MKHITMTHQMSSACKMHDIPRLKVMLISLIKYIYVTKDRIQITIWQDNNNNNTEFAINKRCSYIIHTLSHN